MGRKQAKEAEMAILLMPRAGNSSVRTGGAQHETAAGVCAQLLRLAMKLDVG